eukprot:TRINITY_DN882_c0_g1_i6.p1 TRINITY_DN882_c0_g1~~TRINITY_DN882_c0_g1_i6.p1  ORF type:complete len:484 (+),score=78.15 TRINITY_DN882_c0_g1_i6:95-1546(+)
MASAYCVRSSPLVMSAPSITSIPSSLCPPADMPHTLPRLPPLGTGPSFQPYDVPVPVKPSRGKSCTWPLSLLAASCFALLSLTALGFGIAGFVISLVALDHRHREAECNDMVQVTSDSEGNQVVAIGALQIQTAIASRQTESTSVGSPTSLAMRFTAHPSTGFYLSADGGLCFVVNGTEALCLRGTPETNVNGKLTVNNQDVVTGWEEALQAHNAGVMSHTDGLRFVPAVVSTAVTTHNENATAHSAGLTVVDKAVGAHNKNATAHAGGLDSATSAASAAVSAHNSSTAAHGSGLDVVTSAVSAHNSLTTAHAGGLDSATSAASAAVSAHNSSTAAHGSGLDVVTSAVSAHNSLTTAHAGGLDVVTSAVSAHDSSTAAHGSASPRVAVSSADYHTCAVLDNRELKCWGSGSYGKLGYGNADHIGDGPNEMGDALPAVDVGTGRTVKQVSGGDAHTCAVLDTLATVPMRWGTPCLPWTWALAGL